MGAPPKKTRSEKVVTAIEGDDEFSVASVDPMVRQRKLTELNPKRLNNKPEATHNERTVWRLFRKLF